MAILSRSCFQAIYIGSWWDTSDSNRSIQGVLTFVQFFWKTETFISHFEDFLLRRDSKSVYILSALGRYLVVTVIFLYNSKSRNLRGKTSHFQVHCTFHFYGIDQWNYVVMGWYFSPCFQKGCQSKFSRPVFPIYLYAFYSLSKTISLQLKFFPAQLPNLLKKYLFLKEPGLVVELVSDRCIFQYFLSTTKVPYEVPCLTHFRPMSHLRINQVVGFY